MERMRKRAFLTLATIFAAGFAYGDDSEACLACHTSISPALVMQWEDSSHAGEGVGCI